MNKKYEVLRQEHGSVTSRPIKKNGLIGKVSDPVWFLIFKFSWIRILFPCPCLRQRSMQIAEVLGKKKLWPRTVKKRKRLQFLAENDHKIDWNLCFRFFRQDPNPEKKPIRIQTPLSKYPSILWLFSSRNCSPSHFLIFVIILNFFNFSEHLAAYFCA